MSAQESLPSVFSRPARRGALAQSWQRFVAMFVKEFIQLRRDRPTFAMIVGIPLIQLMLFGYAINTDPKHLPTAVLTSDDSPIARALIGALRATDYFNIKYIARGETDADKLILSNKVQFVIQIPPDFSRQLVRGEK
ncbi:MAG TPA: ABC transporter permease, partial [Methylocystis sp.]